MVFYGSPETDPAVLEALPGPILGIFGSADQSIPVEQPHAFVQHATGVKTGGAQAEAWNQMLRFLGTNLKNKSAGTSAPAWSDYRAPFAWKYYVLLVYEHAFGIAGHTH